MPRSPLRLAIAAAVFASSAAAAPAPRAPLPGPVLPDGLGVNIHFTDPRPGEMEMLARAGFRWVRMDFSWGGTEREKGVYDFSAYDRLLRAMEPHGLRALFILDYGNRHYDNGLSPCSEEGRQAMARWAAAAARRFQGRGILWEMWNEPNIGFWKPKPNPDDYVQLARAVGRAIREAAPGETYIGPATSGIDLDFLETCFKAGLLESWDAVSVHPYRQNGPESAAPEYRRLRRLIARYAPRGKHVPILSGEWGYSAAWRNYNEEIQGRYLPRQWLTNIANEIPLSIWYDWHDDGQDAKDPEHHFGTVRFPYVKGRDPVYDPKPAYLAARALTSQLDGFRFRLRLAVGGAEDHVLLFAKEADVRLVAWTTAPAPRPVTIPASPGPFQAVGHTGEPLPALAAGPEGLAVTLTGAPQYLAPQGPNDLLRVAAAWERAPLEIPVAAPKRPDLGLALQNPLPRAIRVRSGGAPFSTLEPGASLPIPAPLPGDLPRAAEPLPIRIEVEVEGLGRVAQETQVLVTNPLAVVVHPRAGGALPVRVENPSGEAFAGSLRVEGAEGLKPTAASTPLVLKAGEPEKLLRVALEPGGTGAYRVGAAILDASGRAVLRVPALSFAPVDDFARLAGGGLEAAYAVVPDGDAQIGSELSIAVAAPPEGPPMPGMGVLRIAYRFDPGWKFLRLVPKTPASLAIEGKPRALGMWVYGDGEGNLPRLRFIDATGQCFQPSAPAVSWKGWRYVTFAMDGTEAGYWGGANNGIVQHPIRWDTLFLLDGAHKKTQGTIYLAGPTLLRD